jgi:23S rRNA (uracil1939-C5)-methyltransferase
VRLEGRVRDIVQNGEAVVETPRGVVFLRGALIGERVSLALDARPGRVLRGRLLRVLEPSAARVEPSCPHASRCGGCSLLHASVAEQRALRLRLLREALRKAGWEAPIHETHAEQQLGYRRRARLAFQVERGGRKLGFRRERSHELADVESCEVLHARLGAALAALRVRLLPELAGEGELSLALGRDEQPVLVLRSPGPQPPPVYSACAALVAEAALCGIGLYAAGASKPALFGDPTEWSEGFDGQPLAGALGGFSQAHAEINRALVGRVVELAAAPGQRLLELYAGHGNFSVALAREAAGFTAVEHDPGACAALRQNFELRGLVGRVVEGDALAYPIPAGIDVALLDPPRTGAPGLLGRLALRKPKRILYVSCNPQTLARDLAELHAERYRPAWVEAFEMFPQTAELETLVCAERI